VTFTITAEGRPLPLRGVRLADLVLQHFTPTFCTMCNELNRRNLLIGVATTAAAAALPVASIDVQIIDPWQAAVRLCAEVEDPLDRAFLRAWSSPDCGGGAIPLSLRTWSKSLSRKFLNHKNRL
jgi:hypothetical protein